MRIYQFAGGINLRVSQVLKSLGIDHVLVQQSDSGRNFLQRGQQKRTSLGSQHSSIIVLPNRSD